MNYPAIRLEGLRELFQEEMYGWLPPVVPLPVREEIEFEPGLRLQRMGGIDLLHAQPSGRARATFVGVNFGGNHTVFDHPDVPEPRGWTYPDAVSRGGHRERWCLEEVMRAGFGLATFCHSDVVPDEPGLAGPILSGFGAIAAWAWGLLSVAQSIEGPVVFVGHSRMGKASLLAGAFGGDGVVSIQSGCGGAAPSRTRVGETVGQITTMFPHWFAPRFAGYAGREEALPFDQHGLLALCAPRPLLLLNAEEDLWANPEGQEEMAALASDSTGALIECRRRAGGHSVVREDWEMVLGWGGLRWPGWGGG